MATSVLLGINSTDIIHTYDLKNASLFKVQSPKQKYSTELNILGKIYEMKIDTTFHR